ncbi:MULTISPECIES: MFS transporter [unclassified Nocardioides]|uniref:MFS transporter n=1 Tax=unclassified Nocardioides TaxID=2615069 RepID=UPI00191036F3|nr:MULTISPECIES: MFS transporter [unclassified Nocardioides]
MLAALALVVSAVPALNVALPDVARDTGASFTQVQWIVDAYALVFAGLLLPAGALGDRYGRKPLLVGGLAAFGIAAICASFVSEPGALIGLRGVMGIGAAMVMPTTLSIITTTFSAGERGKAVGAWVGVAGAGAILGLLGSGLLLEFWSWPSVFLASGGIVLLIAVAAVRFVPNSRDDDAAPVDYRGGLLSVIGLAGIVYGAIEGPSRGWTAPITLLAFVIGLLGILLWIWAGLKSQEPMLDPRYFLRRDFATGVGSIALQFFIFFGFIFVLIQYLQLVLGYSPLQAGLAMLPMGMALGALSRRVPRLVEKVGRRRPSVAGFVSMAAGLAVLSQLGVGSSYWWVLAGIVPVGVGMALAAAPATADIVASMPADKQGVASAVNDAAREVGGTLGIAVLGSVLNAQYRAGIQDGVPSGAPSKVVAVAQDSLGAALAVADRLGVNGAHLADFARDSFLDGLATAFTASAVLLGLAAVALLVAIPGRTRIPAPHDVGSPRNDQVPTGTEPNTERELT